MTNKPIFLPPPPMPDALCLKYDEQAVRNGDVRFTEMQPRFAAKICRSGCPELVTCQKFGLEEPMIDPNDSIVWGGLMPIQRRVLKERIAADKRRRVRRQQRERSKDSA
jgi:hypothetical protein